MKQTLVYISFLSLINFGVILGLSLIPPKSPPSPSASSVVPTRTPIVSPSPDPLPTRASPSPVPPSPRPQVSRPPPAPTRDPRCIIKVDGRSYDVTSFRYSHSGGDIFACGTDMSTVFHNQHNSRYLEMMAPYAL